MKVGSDIQSVVALKATIGLRGNRAVFTRYEREYCEARPDLWSSLGGLLSAKEACFKALSGVDELPPSSFLELEIRHAPNGRPFLRPGPRLARWMGARKIQVDLAISHSADYATATAIATVER